MVILYSGQILRLCWVKTLGFVFRNTYCFCGKLPEGEICKYCKVSSYSKVLLFSVKLKMYGGKCFNELLGKTLGVLYVCLV